MRKNKKRNSNKGGFTIMELIVVLATIGIISVVSWSALRGSKPSAQLTGACNEAAAMINKTRGYALSGKMASGAVPNSFQVRFLGSAIMIQETGETVVLPGGVTCSSETYVFSVPHGDKSGSANNVTCQNSSGTKIVEVTEFRAVCK